MKGNPKVQLPKTPLPSSHMVPMGHLSSTGMYRLHQLSTSSAIPAAMTGTEQNRYFKTTSGQTRFPSRKLQHSQFCDQAEL